ncbi:NAD(P)/FAD-dependent oxidoreductase [Haloferax sp. YSMS24]|uniref:NAD(P)/FAD-dependent oxidoreductase n=1 Tax=Haloferax sp. YSMS24 TaxID=3388425 RepID=UPI00398D5D61
MSESDGYHVVGGGIVGAAIAYHLSERTDDPIHVYEKGSLADETTSKSFAFFGFYGDETQYRMKRYAIEQYNEFMADPRASPGYVATGRLDVATTTDGADALRTNVEERGDRLADARGKDADTSPVDYLPSDELGSSMFLPFLDTDRVEGGVYRPNVGYLTPVEFALEYVERARENGVTFHEQTEITDLHVEDETLVGLSVDGEFHPAEAVVAAAGPWNQQVAEMAGVDIPVKHTLAPVLELEPSDPLGYTLPWITHHESGFTIRRDPDGTVMMTHHPVGGYDDATEYDPDAWDDTVPDEIRERGLETLYSLLPDVESFDVVDERVGIRSSTPDRNPVVGWTRVEGFSIAAYSTSGIQLAPASGKVIAAQLLDDDPTSYYEPLSIARFDGYVDWR